LILHNPAEGRSKSGPAHRRGFFIRDRLFSSSANHFRLNRFRSATRRLHSWWPDCELTSRNGRQLAEKTHDADALDQTFKNDQVDRGCWRRPMGCDIGAKYDAACAARSAGRSDRASRRWLRPRQNPRQRCLRRKNHHPPDPPSPTQVCAMASRSLRFVRVNALMIG
jgi:hypothetical protein